MKIYILAVATLSLVSAPAIAGAPIEGNWTNPQENVVVRIAPCGLNAGVALCGHAISGSPRAKAKAVKSGFGNLVGAPLMHSMVPNGAGQWKGVVFVPDRNIHASGTIRMVDANRIKVSGCLLGFLCKSQVWKRVG
jgi:uncharacterized protein (DUF2147 family)